MQIEIFSDVICPWCFIGKRRLDLALAGELGREVRLRWRPYQLYPRRGAGRGGGETAAPPERRRFSASLLAEADSAGLELRQDKPWPPPDTLDAHRLLEFAHPFGRQHELAELLFRGFFCEGADLEDKNTLVRLAAQAGLPAGDAAACLHSDTGLEEMQGRLRRAREVGVGGVPGFLFPNGYLLTGAQTAEVMAHMIRRVREMGENQPAGPWRRDPPEDGDAGISGSSGRAPIPGITSWKTRRSRAAPK